MGLADLCGFEPRGGIPEEDSDYSNINQPSLSHVFQENYNISSQAFEYPPSSKVDTMSTAAKSVHARKVPIPEVEKISNPTLPDPDHEGTRERHLLWNDPTLICNSRDIQEDYPRIT